MDGLLGGSFLEDNVLGRANIGVYRKELTLLGCIDPYAKIVLLLKLHIQKGRKYLLDTFSRCLTSLLRTHAYCRACK
jgi:hypothetical protein